MEKLKKIYSDSFLTRGKSKYFLAIIAVVPVFILSCVLITLNNNSVTIIQYVTMDTIEEMQESGDDFLLLVGDKYNGSLNSFVEIFIESKIELRDEQILYIFDISNYFAAINELDISEEQRENAVNVYSEVGNKLKINSIPQMIYFRDGELESVLSQFLSSKTKDPKISDDDRYYYEAHAVDVVKQWIERLG